MSMGAKVKVYLSRAESAEWGDAEFRETFLARLKPQVREKGRKYYEVFDAAGRTLVAGAVDA
jgi:hypothetical protein